VDKLITGPAAEMLSTTGTGATLNALERYVCEVLGQPRATQQYNFPKTRGGGDSFKTSVTDVANGDSRYGSCRT